MAGKRFWIADDGPYTALPTKRVQTAAAATIIEKGMLIKFTSNGSPYGTPLVTEDFTIGTDTAIYGLAANDSTHTATADGYIDVYLPLPGVVYEGYAKTAANANTQAKINALEGDRVSINISATTSAGDWTVNESDGETQAAAFQIVGGDPTKSTIKFIIRHGATFLGDQDLS